MSPNKINIGYVYTNRGKGRTRRKVLDISNHVKTREGQGVPYGVIGVLYEPQPYSAPDLDPKRQNAPRVLSLESFAHWAGKIEKPCAICPHCRHSFKQDFAICDLDKNLRRVMTPTMGYRAPVWCPLDMSAKGLL